MNPMSIQDKMYQSVSTQVGNIYFFSGCSGRLLKFPALNPFSVEVYHWNETAGNYLLH